MSKDYLVTIGLEVHTQLNTQTKIFCGCAVEFGSPPNKNVCPVCLGLPGSLPVLNERVFELALRAVLAFEGEPAPSGWTKFDRKNYFYPDLPKGYQISQYDLPLGKGGEVKIASSDKPVRLNRIHLEEDAGKLIHDQSPDSSLVDLNRAGTPLIEIVSEPDLETTEQAHEYLTELKSVLKAIGVSDCDMEKGHLRCDANISVRRNEKDALGKKVEIKNLNSFKAVKTALQYEIKRQSEALEKGGVIHQETRLWDEARQMTFSMRSKEEAHDYRYFPEPDLLRFPVPGKDVERIRKSLPELPKKKKERFMKEYGLSDYDAKLLSQDNDIAGFFTETAGKVSKADCKSIANWIIGPIFTYLNEHNKELNTTRMTPDHLVKLDTLVSGGKISFQAAKDKIFQEVIENGRDPETMVREKGLEQVSDKLSLERWVEEAVRENPKVVSDFKSGKEASAMFLVGQVMRKSKGKANPGMVQELVRKRLA